MPYIEQDRRKELDSYVDLLVSALEGPMVGLYSAGEINYAITRMLYKIWTAGPSYTTAAQLVGILETLKLEFYRRVVVPYEDAKREENGDVY